MLFKIEYPPGATPLSPEEAKGLIPSDINNHGELNKAEQANIISAEQWAFGGKKKNILTDDFLKKVHKEMFGDVWKWAGQNRKTEKNIGVTWPTIPAEVHKLLDDTKYWIENGTYDWDELGARLHHKLVLIHPFPNGNGRHARLYTDLVLFYHEQPRFTWGSAPLDGRDTGTEELRKKYISALREADAKKMRSLIEFVRS